MNDAIRKQLQKLLNNPGMFNPEDMELAQETDMGQDYKIESPDGAEYEEQPELAAAAQDVAAKSEQGLAGLQSAMPKEKPYQMDSEITKQLRKLRDGESLDEVEVTPAVIDDPTAPMELRKAAMEKVRNKYLGR